jgi:hypothetical protein
MVYATPTEYVEFERVSIESIMNAARQELRHERDINDVESMQYRTLEAIRDDINEALDEVGGADGLDVKSGIVHCRIDDSGAWTETTREAVAADPISDDRAHNGRDLAPVLVRAVLSTVGPVDEAHPTARYDGETVEVR